MKLLSKEQINEIKEMQKSLDEYIRTNNDIPMEQDLIKEKYLAVKTEFFEFVNEIESFKFWKKNKGKDHILEEACDMLHFIFSIAIDTETELEQDEEIIKKIDPSKYDINELLIMTDDTLNEAFFTGSWESLSGILIFLTVILAKCEFTVDDLYNAYIEKNKVNVQRQQENY